jgi:hypothetical protein
MKAQNKKNSDCFKYFFNEKENTYIVVHNDENFDGIYEPIYNNYYLQINYSYEDGNDNIVENFCLKKITMDEFKSTFEIPYISKDIKNMKKMRDIKTKRFYKEIFLYFSGLIVSLVLMNYYLIVLFSIIALFGVFFGNLKVWYECSHLNKENLNNIFIKAKRKKEQKFIKGQHVIITGKKVPLYTTIKFIQWNEEHKDWNYYFDNGNGILKFTTDAFIEAI